MNNKLIKDLEVFLIIENDFDDISYHLYENWREYATKLEDLITEKIKHEAIHLKLQLDTSAFADKEDLMKKPNSELAMMIIKRNDMIKKLSCEIERLSSALYAKQFPNMSAAGG